MRITLTLILLSMYCTFLGQRKITTYHDWQKTRVQEEYNVDAVGQKNGTYKQYDSDGILIEESLYKSGVILSKKAYANDAGVRRQMYESKYLNGEETVSDEWRFLDLGSAYDQDPFVKKIPKNDLKYFEGKNLYYCHMNHYDYVSKTGWILEVANTPEGSRILKIHFTKTNPYLQAEPTSATYLHNGVPFDIAVSKQNTQKAETVQREEIQQPSETDLMRAKIDELKQELTNVNKARQEEAAKSSELKVTLFQKEEEIKELKQFNKDIQAERTEELKRVQSDRDKIDASNKIAREFADSVFYIISSAKPKNRIDISDYCRSVVAMGKAGIGGFSKKDIEIAHIAYLAITEAPNERDQLSQINERLAEGISPSLLIMEIYNRNEGWYRLKREKK